MSLERKKEERAVLNNRLNDIDQRLDAENNKLRKISNAQDVLTSLKSSLDECISILSKSLEQGAEKSRFESLVASNDENYTKACNDFDEQSDILREKVAILHNERENAIQEYEKRSRDDEEK